MRQSVTIVLPHPPQALRPNGRKHWSVKARAVKAYRSLARVSARQALGMDAPPCWAKARVQVIWRSATMRHPDPDSVISSMKAAFDGLQDAGIIENDRGLWPERPKIETRASWSEVVITVEEDLE